MEYYYINTEVKNLETNPYTTWVKEKSAFVSGQEYGVKLGKLNPGDICFMYESGRGVVAVGRVTRAWDGQLSDPPLIYSSIQGPEYRIGVEWFLAFPEHPIAPPILREIVGWVSPQAIQRITNEASARQLVAYAEKQMSKANVQAA